MGSAREGATEKRLRVQELRAPEKQLGSRGAGEREARMDSEAAAGRLEDAPLRLRSVRDSSHWFILPQLKFPDARKRWRHVYDPGLPLPLTIQGLRLEPCLLTASKIGVKQVNSGGLWSQQPAR